MSRDFGSGEAIEPAVDVFALRTFAVRSGRLDSVVQGGGNWVDGVCEARCSRCADHEVPSEDCGCGVYGTTSLRILYEDYPEWAARVVAVIAAEGLTLLGPDGLRTSAARVLAYWVIPEIDSKVGEARFCSEQFPDARRFYDPEVMARLYHLGGA